MDNTLGMSRIFWFLMFVRKYLCLFSLKSIILGLCLLGCSFSVSLLVRFHSLSWYGLIFFIVYVGGLLVLFIYISSLKFNPVFHFSKKNPVFKVVAKLKMMALFYLTASKVIWNHSSLTWGRFDENKFRLNLFNENEVIFLINVGVLLLFVLWIITKLTFRRRGALRPVF